MKKQAKYIRRPAKPNEKPTKGQARAPELTPGREMAKIFDAKGKLIAYMDPRTRKRTPA
jgi:hypothetical protein